MNKQKRLLFCSRFIYIAYSCFGSDKFYQQNSRNRVLRNKVLLFQKEILNEYFIEAFSEMYLSILDGNIHSMYKKKQLLIYNIASIYLLLEDIFLRFFFILFYFDTVLWHSFLVYKI